MVRKSNQTDNLFCTTGIGHYCILQDKTSQKVLLIVYLGVVGVISSIYSVIVTPESWSFSDNYDPNFIFDPMSWTVQIPMIAITTAIQIFLVRR